MSEYSKTSTPLVVFFVLIFVIVPIILANVGIFTFILGGIALVFVLLA